ncbi:hypothetical protein GOZ81_10355 [Agrobacterium vitis]|uniref:hypothetical protein n=1 Tax=Agrobacterium vitis TaxID=373 RepID=UPI0012E82D39|nr:hypothetical protein [Agrobacterium vitis]MVA71476.1 hypothetical protein [Agrobacterium vitis]
MFTTDVNSYEQAKKAERNRVDLLRLVICCQYINVHWVRRVHLNAAKWAIVELLNGDDSDLVDAPNNIAVAIERAAGNL